MGRKTANIKLTIPVQMTFIVTQYHSKTEQKKKKSNNLPYYTNTALYDDSGEPLVERDFEG